MSRNLPARPSLEFLKKEAKSLLDVLQQRDATAQLADAQHALARDYGFASWPKLKAHVESMAVSAPAEREGGHPFVGRWIANVARSKRHPANMFQRAIIEFAVSGNTVNVDDEFVDESGRVVRGHNTTRRRRRRTSDAERVRRDRGVARRARARIRGDEERRGRGPR